MKTVYSFCLATLLLCAAGFKTKAATMIIEVEDFEFDPAIFTVNTGDTIMWMWDDSGGQHTTTSTTIPQGALSWDHVISSNSQMFIYIPTVAGSYDYICAYHYSMGMVGHFTVLGASGVIEASAGTAPSLEGSISEGQTLTVRYNLLNAENTKLSLYDPLGNIVQVLSASHLPAGDYQGSYALPQLKRGMYLLKLETSSANITRRIIFQ